MSKDMDLEKFLSKYSTKDNSGKGGAVGAEIFDIIKYFNGDIYLNNYPDGDFPVQFGFVFPVI